MTQNPGTPRGCGWRRLASLALGCSLLGCVSAVESPGIRSLECIPPFQFIAVGQSIPASCHIDGSSLPIAEGPITWTSSDASIVSFSAGPAGLHNSVIITAKNVGVTTIRASYGGFEATFPLTITAAGHPSLRAEPESISVKAGSDVSASYSATAIDGDGTPRPEAMAWYGMTTTSSNTAVVNLITTTTVDNVGLGDKVISTTELRALRPGTATLTLTLAWITTTLAVTVTQ
jgi:hypothetical protein